VGTVRCFASVIASVGCLFIGFPFHLSEVPSLAGSGTRARRQHEATTMRQLFFDSRVNVCLRDFFYKHTFSCNKSCPVTLHSLRK